LHKRIISLVALGGLCALPACTSGQSAIEPAFTSANVSAQSKLQFAVGTANRGGTVGLNTVVTFRQTNGLSAVLVDTPSIVGPAGFVNNGGAAANTNNGTNTITGTPQEAAGLPDSPATTFGQTGGAFAYGFAPINISTSGAASFTAYSLPFYGTVPGPTAAALPYYVGPGNSVVPNFRDGTQAAGFAGYNPGFVDFTSVALATGTYTLTVNVGTANTAPIAPFTATANLASLVPLPVFPAPTYTSNGAGGGTIGLTVPAGVTEAFAEVRDLTSGNYYTFVTRTVGAQTITVPNNIGTIVNGVAGPTLTVGGNVRVYAVGFDYPAIEALSIGSNPPQAPTIVGANGQADITASPYITAAE
jgi:hypothetical protein